MVNKLGAQFYLDLMLISMIILFYIDPNNFEIYLHGMIIRTIIQGLLIISAIMFFLSKKKHCMIDHRTKCDQRIELVWSIMFAITYVAYISIDDVLTQNICKLMMSILALILVIIQIYWIKNKKYYRKIYE